MKIMVAFLNQKNKSRKVRSKRKIKEDVDNLRYLSDFGKKNKKYYNINENRKNNKSNLKDYSNVSFKEFGFNNLKDRKDKILKFKDLFLFATIFAVSFLVIKNKFNFFVKKFEVNNEKNIKVEDYISLSSAFDKSSYIFSTAVSKDTKNNNENINTEMKEDETASREEKIIDDKAASYNSVNTFFNNDEISQNVFYEDKNFQKITLGNGLIVNSSSNRNIDFKSLLNSDVILTKKSDKILLYNTHTSESYSNSENYKFEYSGTMRSQDSKYNMLAIAKSLNENLLKKGFDSIQDTTPHDYGAYTIAYSNSRKTVTNRLSELQSAGIIIDVHRDAIEDLTFRPVTNIDGVQVAQLMIVIGIGTNTTDNPYYEDNLKLALKIQEIGNKIYPGLFRQILVRDAMYNQDLNKYSILVEFGATGNTIDEVKLSTRCLSNLLNIIYKD